MKDSNGALPLWEIERHVIRVIHAQTGLDTRIIHVGSRLLEDLNIDSLDMVELILAVEGTERQPMVLVSWHGAAAYSLWAHGRDWRGFRSGECALPTEAQWEYAARGARSRRYPWGDEPARPELASTDLHVARRLYLEKLPLAEVTERLGMSPFGGHHMAGTVWNWCADWYEPRFYESIEARAANPCCGRATGIRSERGGRWGGPAWLARGSLRRGRPPPREAR